MVLVVIITNTRFLQMNLKISKVLIFNILAFVFLTCSQSIYAANLYRCGNSYQDTPCKDATKPIKSLGQSSNKVADEATTQPQKVDADCKQRGDTAKKIMWTREVGKTADQQMESPQDGYTGELVRDVYNHHGSSLEVKNAIEQECMQQKEQVRLAAKLLIEAQRLRAGESASTGSANSKEKFNTPKEPDQLNQKVSAIGSGPDSDEKRNVCATLKSKVENIADKRRNGGSANYMNDLKLKQNQAESDMASLGC